MIEKSPHTVKQQLFVILISYCFDLIWKKWKGHIMSNILEKHRMLVLYALIATVVISSGITIEYENVYSDSISISVTVLAGIGLFLAAVIFFIEEIESICNP